MGADSFGHIACNIMYEGNNNNREDIMNKNAITRTKTKTDVGREASKFALNVGMGMAVLIGVWGLVSLFEGLLLNGFSGVLRGFWTAVTGY